MPKGLSDIRWQLKKKNLYIILLVKLLLEIARLVSIYYYYLKDFSSLNLLTPSVMIDKI